jgi:hypothetical protein
MVSSVALFFITEKTENTSNCYLCYNKVKYIKNKFYVYWVIQHVSQCVQ